MNSIKRSPLVAWLTLFAMTISLCGSAVFAVNASAQVTPTSKQRSQSAKSSALASYAIDLTEMARLGLLDAGADRAEEVKLAMQILSRDERNNPVVIGESAIETRAVAESLALRIANNDAPQNFRGTRVFALNVNSLFAGVKTASEFTARMQSVLEEAAQSGGKVILYAPELQQFVGVRAATAASQAIAKALTNGDVRLIGGTSASAYAEYIDSDDSVKDFFAEVRMNEHDTKRFEPGINADEFVGDKVSPDLRDALNNSKGNDRITVIIQVADINNRKLNSLFQRHDVRVVSRLPQLGIMSVEMPIRAAEELAANDQTRYLSLDNETRTLGYSHIENTTGASNIRTGVLPSGTLNGTGVGIAIIDSGIWRNHDGFKDMIAKAVDFTGENQPDSDPFGHGTHVAGLAAATNTLMGGAFTGIAPKAKLISLRVLKANGIGSSTYLLSALDWTLANRTQYNIRVVNMSLGALAINSYKNDPLCRAVRRLVDAGVVVVASAGNSGKNSAGEKVYGHIHSPGNEPSAITVGASNTFGTDVRSDDNIATFSSRGPTRSYWTDAEGVKQYDNLVKPDMVAPGNKLYSAKSEDNLLADVTPGLDLPSVSDEKRDQMSLSGTSMASPVVAGAAALLLQVNPKLTPNMVKMILMYTAQPIQGFNQFEQGAGLLNLDGAVRLAKLVRTDITASTPMGAPLLTSATPPTPQSTIAGETFTWGQGIILNYTFAYGIEIITHNQAAYRNGILMTDGVCASSSGTISRNGILMTDGVQVSNDIITNDGILLSDGRSVTTAGILMSDGRTFPDGVLLSDGVLISDGVLLSDGILLSDTVTQAMSSMLNGDNTASMTPVIPEN